MDPRARIDAIETLIHQDVGRHTAPLFAAARGGLWKAASALAATRAPRVGLITGFYVPLGRPPAAETDGPAAAALLVLFFTRIGAACRVLTDAPCASACRAALDAAELADVPLDVAAVDANPDAAEACWRQHRIDWAIAIERCGPAADGQPRNMRGQDMGGCTAPLHRVFSAGPWRTIGIADGGNELGMGSLPAGLVAEFVPFGDAITCVTPADHLVMAGVSHWGAYALIAALGVLRPAWRQAALECLDASVDQGIVDVLVQRGPAVDGVTLEHTATIDGLDMATHGRKLAAARALVEQASGGYAWTC
jgi:D-glutamate cyclase